VLPDVTFAVGATAADAPPPTANDAPAAPKKGKAVVRRFLFEPCFACVIGFSHTHKYMVDE